MLISALASASQTRASAPARLLRNTANCVAGSIESFGIATFTILNGFKRLTIKQIGNWSEARSHTKGWCGPNKGRQCTVHYLLCQLPLLHHVTSEKLRRPERGLSASVPPLRSLLP